MHVDLFQHLAMGTASQNRTRVTAAQARLPERAMCIQPGSKDTAAGVPAMPSHPRRRQESALCLLACV